MRNKTLAQARPVDADRYLRDPQHRARFSELLNPAEAAAHVAASFLDLDHQGWAIRIELISEELELLQRGGQTGHLQLDVLHCSPGLPVAVLRTQAEGVEFRFGVPLWQPAAQAWLLDAIDRERFLLLLDPTNGGVGVALKGFGHLFVDRVSLISATTLTRELGAVESQEQMLSVGLKLLQDRAGVAPLPGQKPIKVRAAIAAWGKDAVVVMGALMTAETARVAAWGHQEEANTEGTSGLGLRD